MIIGVAGATSRIARAFINNHCTGEDVIERRDAMDLPAGCDQYLICSGLLYGKNTRDMKSIEAAQTFEVNFFNIAKFCDSIFNANQQARVCIIGSESGEKGSYDMAYAGAKSAVHLYVKQKRLVYREQHLVCVSPWIISDAKMTTERKDFGQLLAKGTRRRIGRWLTSTEVARVAHFALNEPGLCNEVISMKGGNW
jgi:NAD(P)-dependent dehydrogenase (short-subunit alcohol dehydrogenase family)